MDGCEARFDTLRAAQEHLLIHQHCASCGAAIGRIKSDKLSGTICESCHSVREWKEERDRK